MPYPVNPGTVNYSSAGANASAFYIPQIWSSKTILKFYEDSIYEKIMLTDYEGEIKNQGDKVVIRTTPDITISDYVKGAGLTYEEPESPHTELDIDQGHYAAFRLFDVDRIQSDLNLMNDWATDAAEQLKAHVNRNIFGTIFANAAAENAGATAGKFSGNINLGTSGTPLTLTKANVVDWVVDLGLVLDEQSRPDTDRFLVIPPSIAALIKTSELKDASLSGDGKSTLRSGLIGSIDRFAIYSSNHVNSSAGKHDVVFGHKNANQFAAQIVINEMVKDINDFGDLSRMLMVYGFATTDPDSLGHSVVTR